MWWSDIVEHPEYLRFDSQVFNYCFDDKGCFFECSEVRSRADPFDDGLFGWRVESFFIDVTLQALINRGQSASEKLVAHVVHDHVVTGTRSDLRYSISHRARAYHANDISHEDPPGSSLRFSAISALLCVYGTFNAEDAEVRREIF